MVEKSEISSDLLNEIKSKRQKLEKVAISLKSHFVGLDNVIDNIIKNIESWYILPDFIKRPIIINLWGMTGVGKTDLVRRLVKLIDFQDRFVEIQLSNNQNHDEIGVQTIQSVLCFSNIEPEKPGVLLLDEIQKFRHIDESGEEMRGNSYQDVWTLLSDGRFGVSSNSKDTLYSIVFDSLFYKENPDEDYDENPIKTANKKYKRDWHTARRLKKSLRLKSSVSEIMTWDIEKKDKVISESLNNEDFYEGDDYSKLLIFVSGNLDDAFTMASQCEEIDFDADLFHQYSLKINILTIKKCLKQRFKPEHISRLGNVHIIYPSLSKASYDEISRRKVNDIIQDIKTRYNVDLYVDKSIFDFIYRNGVFPTQGTRPLFTTISSFLENSLPYFLLISLENNESSIHLSFNQNNICGKIGGQTYTLKYEGDIDKIKQKKSNNDNKTIAAVHEAGHAVAYAVLFGLVPTQITSRTASDQTGGFIGIHQNNPSYENMLKEIAVSLSGRVSEEIIFGKDFVTSGAIGDIEKATTMAGNMVRNLGMFHFSSKIVSEHIDAEDAALLNHNDCLTNIIIEDIVKAQEQRANKLILHNIDLFKEVSDNLINLGMIDDDQFKKICENHGVVVKSVEAKEFVCSGYAESYAKFFETKKI